MSNYTLTHLETGSFEDLIQALTIKAIGPGVTIFGDGADGGREATFEGQTNYPFGKNGWNGYGVIQAKFHKRIDATEEGQYSQKDDEWALKQLKAELEKFLDPTKPRRKPEYYVFATNVVLTPVQDKGSKDKALALLKKYSTKIPLKGYAIWGYDQINAFLGSYEDVRHGYEEFLRAGDVFARILANLDSHDEYFVQDELEKLTAVFEPPAQYEQAKAALLTRRMVMLAGPPHIGKTATALHLAHILQQEKNLNAVVRIGSGEQI